MIDYYRWARPKFTIRSASVFAAVIVLVAGVIVLGVS